MHWEYHAGDWISPMFFQGKGRNHPNKELEEQRPMANLVMVNAALRRSPDHWATMFPTVEGMLSSIPVNAGHFCFADIKGAFGRVLIHPECRHLVVVLWNGKLYAYRTMPQGLAPSALFWNCYIVHALNTALGVHWRAFFAGFVDDWVAHAPAGQPERCKNRARILMSICRVLGLPISHKCGAYNLEAPQVR